MPKFYWNKKVIGLGIVAALGWGAAAFMYTLHNQQVEIHKWTTQKPLRDELNSYIQQKDKIPFSERRIITLSGQCISYQLAKSQRASLDKWGPGGLFYSEFNAASISECDWREKATTEVVAELKKLLNCDAQILGKRNLCVPNA